MELLRGNAYIFAICVFGLLIAGCQRSATPQQQSLRLALIEAVASSDSFSIQEFNGGNAAEEYPDLVNLQTIHAAFESSNITIVPNDVKREIAARFTLSQGERTVANFDYCNSGIVLFKNCCLKLEHVPFAGCFK
jgi:nitrous oxide reductase accessory protein NosL